MEDARAVRGLGLSRTKALRAAALILFTFIICRGPLMAGCFPAAISLIAYMLSRSAANIYLLIPAAAGMILTVPRGYDPWGDLAAMLLCGLLFLAARRMKLALWQRAVIAAAMTIVCVSIYRLATGTVYKLGIEALLTEGLVVLAMVFVFDTFFALPEKGKEKGREMGREKGARAAAGGTFRELMPVSVTVMLLLVINGLGAAFLAWLAIMFMGLWALIYVDVGAAFMVSAAGGAAAALTGQGQWGVMATVMMGLAAAAIAKKYGALAAAAAFVFVCRVLGSVESGVILGVDGYSLLISSAAFLVLHWKFGARLTAFAGPMRMPGGKDAAGQLWAEKEAEDVLRDKIERMTDLAELYDTYLDSRSVLADQFSMMGQILEDTKRRVSGKGRKAARHIHEKIRVEAAISQCAAAGAINGDCCGWQDMGDGRVVLVVSDGMGKGKKAAAESLMVTRTILCLLKAGATVDAVLKMINTIMMIKEDEDSYATVDLAIIDKRTAKGRFYKIGAAPTLIRRKENVEEVRLSAVPLGTVNGLRIRYVEAALKKEDWIIMMSDGVSDGGKGAVSGGGDFLDHIISAAASVRSRDPQVMCDLLLDQAADSYIGRERDDMTVLVAKVL